MSGTGTGYPLGIGSPGITPSVLNPLPKTLLSLSKFAKIVGVNPSHFWGASPMGTNPVVLPISQQCDSVWYQYGWQDNDKVSRYEVAETIYSVEQEIADALGYYPSPVWIAGEEHDYPKVYRRDYYGTGANIRGGIKSISADYGRIIDHGVRALTYIGTATVAGGSLVYSDEDSDGYYETATISMATTATNASEIKAYHTGLSGDEEWEIRDPRSKKISGGGVTFVFDSWLLINPELYELYPTDAGQRAIDITTTAYFVTSVDIYREYNDTTAVSAVFSWANGPEFCESCGGSGCSVCGETSQNGCLKIDDKKLGIVSPVPASYSGGWTYSSWSGGREPDRVAISYYSGERGREFMLGRTYDPMPFDLAQAIAYMTLARLDRPLCECGNVNEIFNMMKTHLTKSSSDGSFFATRNVLNSPFGQTLGEVKAWIVVNNLRTKRAHVAVI